jgi:small subunit ribosomal protein S17
MAEQTAVVRKNEKVGQVVSTKMQKTIVVEVSRRVPHPIYKRIITRRKKFYAHDETEQAKVGDVVRILEHRPMSKMKRWILGDVVRRAIQVGETPAELTGLTTEADSRSKKGAAKKAETKANRQ